MSGFRLKIKEFAPRGWRDAWLQFGLFLLVYYGYQLVRGLVDSKEALAIANADRVIDLERATGTFFEPDLQSAAIHHARWLVDFANFMYVNSHFVITTLFLSWLYFRRNEHFYFVRNMFMVAMLTALVLYAVYPTAPPRLMSGYGFVDTIDQFTGLPQDGDTAGFLVNRFAAVPSMHIGFSLMIAVPGLVLSRRPFVRAWWSIYPLLVFFVIVTTGNHYWFDAAAGAAVACVAAVAARQLARARPDHWAWEPAEAPA
jgi:hypothetical protein